MKLIMVVDGNATLRDLVARILPSTGYEVLTAAKEAEALSWLGKEWTAAHRPFELILSELVLPDMSGLALAKAVRALPHYQALTFAFMAGGGHLSQSDFSLLADEAVLLKPFGYKELTTFIRHHIN